MRRKGRRRHVGDTQRRRAGAQQKPTPNPIRSIDKSRATDWIEGALASPPLHLDSLASVWSRPGRRVESPPSPPRVSSTVAARNPFPTRKIPRDLIDGGITIWCWIIHFCNTSNVVFVWNGQFSISKSAILYFLSVMIYFSTIQALGEVRKTEPKTNTFTEHWRNMFLRMCQN
ncbi:uncharacterized protein [Aegilops tauschii subsp. strangulata]|uniref:uncharacterized protein n=1 Tax=Aegilops tauschii subsp. strangulata TaxID=200361 RepID=UPI00098ABEFA|nr:uncharacterized protein LOC109735099 isoform X1 [Aegilops tauschii subsp. strangulata]XP_045083752.1 uncharacterized protein LOC109735099 isoform X1 [Aegilops tauschii subsp. strangulata]